MLPSVAWTAPSAPAAPVHRVKRPARLVLRSNATAYTTQAQPLLVLPVTCSAKRHAVAAVSGSDWGRAAPGGEGNRTLQPVAERRERRGGWCGGGLVVH